MTGEAYTLALASLVALRPGLIGLTCPAWIESTGRECGRPQAEGLLCTRHHAVALRRFAAEVEQEKLRRAKRAAERERLLPEKRARLAQVEAEIARRDPPRPDDTAAYVGAVHPSITKRKMRYLSDTNVSRMATLCEQRRALIAWIGDER